MLLCPVLIALLLFCAPAGAFERSVAVFNISGTSGSSDPDVFSLEEALTVAGVPFSVTDDVAAAVTHGLVVVSSRVTASTLSPAVRAALVDYVAAGGHLLIARLQDPALFGAFGIAGASLVSQHYALSWDIAAAPALFSWFDDPLEQTISLARESVAGRINTVPYQVGSADILARFDDGTAALTRHAHGAGVAYAFGAAFKDLVLRNQLNRDFQAQRVGGNGFEPTTDTIALLLRQLHGETAPHAVWRHSSPGASASTLIITHDLDAQTSMDKAPDFAASERRHGVDASYLVTTHYIEDTLDDDYYSANTGMLATLVDNYHHLGSHSVGHFPDFDDESVIGVGTPGNSAGAYQPFFDGTETQDGTLYGELEVSRQLLIDDAGATVGVFRSGYLLWHDQQTNVLDALGYAFDSSSSANQLLLNFPFRLRFDRSFNGTISSLLELPMTISDFRFADDMIPDRVAHWLDVIGKNTANHAPTVLLIHPNTADKLVAQELLIEQLPAGTALRAVSGFGSFWQRRSSLAFSSDLNDGVLEIVLDTTAGPPSPELALIIEDGAMLTGIEVSGSAGEPYQYLEAGAAGNRRRIHGLAPVPDLPVYLDLPAATAALTAPMELVTPTGDAMSFLLVPEGSGDVLDSAENGGSAAFEVSVAGTGAYAIWGLVQADGDVAQSVFLSIDDGAPALWDLPPGQHWQWVRFGDRFNRTPVPQTLAAGAHTLTVRQREDGVALARLLITNDLDYAPGSFGRQVPVPAGGLITMAVLLVGLATRRVARARQLSTGR